MIRKQVFTVFDTVCEAIRANPELSNVAIGRVAGVSEAAVRRHKRHMDLEDVDPFFQVPNMAITSRGKSVRLEDGSWEKVSWNPAAVALAEAQTYEDLTELLDNEAPQAREADRGVGGTLHVCLADFQVGKTDENGGTPELLKRFQVSLDNVVTKIQNERPGEVFLWELGDVLENFNNTSQQRETNDLDLTTQIRVARRLVADVIRAVAFRVNKVVLVSVPSNHGAVRVGLGAKSRASTSQNDYGLEINRMLEEVFAGRPEYAHVTFVRPTGLLEHVTVTTQDGTVVGAVHGDQVTGATKMGSWWAGQSHGRRGNLHNADILLFGHHHHFTLNQSGDARWLIGAPSLDGGSAWWTNKTGESSEAGVLAFTTRRGRWGTLEIC